MHPVFPERNRRVHQRNCHLKKLLQSLARSVRRRRCRGTHTAPPQKTVSQGVSFGRFPDLSVKNATLCEASTPCQTYVRPWKRGWLRFNTHSGWMQWWSSLNEQVESVRISGGMIVVTYKAKSISTKSLILLSAYPPSSSGYRHVSDSLLSVFWQGENYQETSSFRSVIHSLAFLDHTAVRASPTLQALRQECRLKSGRNS